MVTASPDRIGRYEILDELGRGSMGRVYLAQDPNIDRRVALKVLAPVGGPGDAGGAELRRRFIREAQAAGRVNHPGIVAVYDAGTDSATGEAYIAMEWVDGESLEEVLGRGPLPAGEVARLGQEIAQALAAAHQAGLVHRDVKPGNILLDGDGHAKISDFGIAKFATLSATGAGQLLGSPFYMSPEQVRNENVDHRSDLFSLGSLLYQAAAGEVPFVGDSLAAITYKVLEIDPTPADSVYPAAGPQLTAVLARALTKDPNARFQDGADFAQALARLELAPGSTSPTGTLILGPPAATATGSAKSSWTQRHRGALLAGLTLIVAPLLVLLMSARTQVEEATPLPATSQTAADADTTQSLLPSATPVEIEPEVQPAIQPGLEQPPARSTPTTAPAATVDIRYRNHLRNGRMTIKVDDVEVWSGEVGKDKGVVGRSVGNDVRPRITVPAGKHVIGIHIEGADGTVDATKRIWAVYEPGSRQRLKVRLVPPRVLRLSWDD